MNQILSGSVFIVLGITLLIMFNRAKKTERESTALQKPYLKNAGIAFILFGIYYLSKYFVN
jgi:hypothetical protein